MAGNSKSIIDHMLMTFGAKRLIVVLHGFRSNARNINGLAELVRTRFPDADVYYPDLPYRHLYSTVPMEQITREVLERISELMLRANYQDIIFVGHSCGGLLVRKLVVAAWGYASDVGPSDPVPWRNRIRRIVFLAAVNRGWAISSALSTLDSVGWRCASLLNEFAFDGRSTIFQTRRGTPFLVASRLQWMKLMREVPQARITVVQLLGTVDDIVSPDDAVDYAADVQCSGPGAQQFFFMLEMPRTGHFDAIAVSDTSDIAACERAAIIGRALTAEEAELACDPRAVNRNHLEDIPPSPPDLDVKKVVFVIHGIRDKGFWTKKIARKIRETSTDGAIRCITKTYGYFPMAPFIFRMYRREKVEWLMDIYADAKAQFPEADFSYVGHSNGTYLVASALSDYPDTEFESIVFAGSVVRQDYDWAGLMQSQTAPALPRVRRMWNFVATADWVVAIFPKGLEPIRFFDLGSAGHDGFASKPAKVPFYEVRFVKGEHSAGIRETQWDEIARFVLDGQPPDTDNPDYQKIQSCFVEMLGKASSEILLVGLALILVIPCIWLLSLAFSASTAILGAVWMLVAISYFLLFLFVVLKL